MPGDEDEMPIVFECPTCRHSFDVDDRWLGERGQCPRCRADVRFPDPDPSEPELIPIPRPKVRVRRLSGLQVYSLIVMGLLVAWIVYAIATGHDRATLPGSPTTTAPAEQAPPKMTLRFPGHPEFQNLMVGSDRSAYDAYLKTIKYKDEIGRLELIGTYRIFPVPAGTEIQAIGPAVAGVQDVRILSGEHFGRPVWTRAEFVNPE